MKVFKLYPDCNRYQNLIFKFKEDWAIIDRFDGRHLSTIWIPLIVEVLRDNSFIVTFLQVIFQALLLVFQYSACEPLMPWGRYLKKMERF
jgi:hypothetical protein